MMIHDLQTTRVWILKDNTVDIEGKVFFHKPFFPVTVKEDFFTPFFLGLETRIDRSVSITKKNQKVLMSNCHLKYKNKSQSTLNLMPRIYRFSVMTHTKFYLCSGSYHRNKINDINFRFFHLL